MFFERSFMNACLTGRRWLCVALAVTSGWSRVAATPFVEYDSEGSFVAALATPFFNNEFASFGLGGKASPQSFSGSGYGYEIGSSDGLLVGIAGFPDFAIQPLNATSTLTVTGFLQPSSGFGGRFYVTDISEEFQPQPITVEYTFSDAATVTRTYTPASVGTFFGIVAESSIASIRISSGGSFFPTIDQAIVGSSAPRDITIDVPAGSRTQAEAGYPTISTAESVTKTGGGTLIFDAVNGYTGPTTVAGGTLNVANPQALSATAVTVHTASTLEIASGTTMQGPSVIVDGGTLAASMVAIDATTGIASVAVNAGTLSGGPAMTIGGGGAFSLAQNARVTVGVGSLSVAEASNGGRLDLGAGAVTVAAGGITPAALRADIIAGRSGGSWSGSTGITSSAAASAGGTRAVGYVVAADTTSTVSFAAPGDTNLNGVVDVFDLVAINSSGTYGSGRSAVWSQGDFNYDGVTNVFDLVSINSAGVYGRGNYFPAAPTVSGGISNVSVVPEPGVSGLSIMIAAAACGLRAAGARRSSPGLRIRPR